MDFCWIPSPSVKETNISQFDGTFSVFGLTLGPLRVQSSCTLSEMKKINETGRILIDRLEANTIYQVCFQTTWHAVNTSIDCLDTKGIHKRHCQLLRTFTKGNVNYFDHFQI